MRRIAMLVLGISAWAVWQTSAIAWGLDGHRSLGKVADILLENDPAGVEAKKILGGGVDLSEAATWARLREGGTDLSGPAVGH